MFNERIIKMVNKHKVVINDKPLPYHVSYMQYFYIAAHFMSLSGQQTKIISTKTQTGVKQNNVKAIYDSMIT
jgi:hypothetical protein